MRFQDRLKVRHAKTGQYTTCHDFSRRSETLDNETRDGQFGVTSLAITGKFKRKERLY